MIATQGWAKPGFFIKTQPSGFNWFKPGLMGFMGQTGENSDSLCKFRIKEPNLENQKIIPHEMDNCCFATPNIPNRK